MTINLDLPPDMASRLQEEAARHGLDTAGYVRALVEDTLRTAPRRSFGTATKSEWRRAFLAWVDSHRDIIAPSIPSEALRREHLYEDRGW